jgi:hypothetical protein
MSIKARVEEGRKLRGHGAVDKEAEAGAAVSVATVEMVILIKEQSTRINTRASTRLLKLLPLSRKHPPWMTPRK